MIRRSLLTMVPAASVLFALRAHGKPITGPAVTSAGFILAVHAWSFRRFTLWESIEMTATTGAGAIELYPGQTLGGPHGETKMGPGLSAGIYESLLDHGASHGVLPVNFGVTEIPKNKDKARPLFEMARTLGLYGLTTESIGAIDTIERLAIDYDLRVSFHNHPKPTALWNPATIWKAVQDRHDNIGFCADIGHWASSGLDPVEVVKKVAPRIRSFHFKDRESIDAPSDDRPYGTGVIDLAAILDEALKHGFTGNVSIEYEYNWETSVPEIAQCVGYLRAYSKLRA
ncbi:MAG: sugar phosphate isomerase/epimerase [Verrucomicrobiales bacterium]